mmetsp:Transcript_25403/g.39836  ORF Transcript_25403/g.39836 Transcript_25403/m.39836 type:complete len:99 (+) Transcript_25403:101-397(+)
MSLSSAQGLSSGGAEELRSIETLRAQLLSTLSLLQLELSAECSKASLSSVPSALLFLSLSSTCSAPAGQYLSSSTLRSARTSMACVCVGGLVAEELRG